MWKYIVCIIIPIITLRSQEEPKFKYVVYWSTIITVSIPCPDREYGFDCGLKHTVEIQDSFEADFVHKKHAIAFAVRQKEKGHVAIELDSVKLD